MSSDLTQSDRVVPIPPTRAGRLVVGDGDDNTNAVVVAPPRRAQQQHHSQQQQPTVAQQGPSPAMRRAQVARLPHKIPHVLSGDNIGRMPAPPAGTVDAPTGAVGQGLVGVGVAPASTACDESLLCGPTVTLTASSTRCDDETLVGASTVAVEEEACDAREVGNSVTAATDAPAEVSPSFDSSLDDDSDEGSTSAAASTLTTPTTNASTVQPKVIVPFRFKVLLGVSSAAMAVSGSAVSYFAINNLNLGPVELNNYWLYTSWSSLLNPMIGFLSDTVQIRGENRRPLVIVGSAVSAAIFAMFAFVGATTEFYGLFVFLSVIQQWAESLINVPLNGMLVEMFLVPEDAKEEAPTAVDDATDDASATKNVQDGEPSAANNEEEEAAAKAAAIASEHRVSVMSNLQAQAMLYRSIGSLVGSSLYTVLVIWLSLDDMLWVSGILYALVTPSVLALSAKWCKAHIEAKEEVLGTKEQGGAGAADGNADHEGDLDHSVANHDEDDIDREALLRPSRLERCMMGSRKFKSIYDRISMGWDWRKPNEGTIGLLFVLLFVFIYTGTPDSGNFYFSYISTQFEFANWLNAFNSTLGMLGSVVGAYVYGWSIDYWHRREMTKRQAADAAKAARADGEKGVAAVPVSTDGASASLPPTTSTHKRYGTTAFHVFTFGSICGSIGYLTNMALATDLVPGKIPIPPYVFVPVDNFLTSLFSRFAFMPIMTVAAERCPVGYEAAAFELFAVTSMLGGNMCSFSSSQIATALGLTYDDYSSLWILILISSLSKLVPPIIAAILPVHEKSATGMLAAAISEATAAATAKDEVGGEGVARVSATATGGIVA